MDRTFVTGGTGFLGRELLERLLRSRRPVLATMRRRGADDTEEQAKMRLSEMLREIDPRVDLASLNVCFADVSQPGLALDAKAHEWLHQGEGPVEIIHGAAQVRFDQPRQVMEAQNVQGTVHVLELAMDIAARGKLRRFDYVSTAFVAGDRSDLVAETDLDVGQTPRNDYERSKLLAELEVQKAKAHGLPVVVFRPSIIVGDSRTGRAASFKVLYWPLKIYARGRWRTIFGLPECSIDVVPVDFVADAMLHLIDSERATGRTFHLAAGPERQSTIGELANMASEFFEQKPPRYIDPDFYVRYLRPILLPFFRLFRPDVAERGGVFLPYLRQNPVFSVDELRTFLDPAGIEPPKVPEYFAAIFRYAKDTDFGRTLALPARSGAPAE